MITDEQRDHFLRAVRSGSDIKAAAAAAGIHRPRVYTLRDRDPVFRARLADAQEAAKPCPLPETPAPRTTGRIRPSDLTLRQRRLVRAFLADFDEPTPAPQPEPAPSAEQQALDAWLSGSEWPRDAELNVAELERLSTRAANSYRSIVAARAEVAARRRRHRPRPDDSAWEAF
jgi:hypothetical protein